MGVVMGSLWDKLLNWFLKRTPEFSGFIIIRLKGQHAPNDEKTLQEFAKTHKLSGLARVIEQLGLPNTQRAIWNVPVNTIRRLEERAAKNHRRPRHSLNSYWRLDARSFWNKADRAIGLLNELEEVDYAYKELAASTPTGADPSNDIYFGSQGHLKKAPCGIDAPAVWAQGVKGEGVAFVDLERGWYQEFDPGPYNEHEDLSRYPILFGKNLKADSNHGTSVLGIVVGRDNDKGIIGIAPGVEKVRLISRYITVGASESQVACGIAETVSLLEQGELREGDVLLLEVQRGYPPKPTEVDDLDFDAIVVAVGCGLIVVEAAGNGDLNLDVVNNASNDRSLARNSADSGAIMVGASQSRVVDGSGQIISNACNGLGAPASPGLHNRWVDSNPIRRPTHSSNYGSRVDCYAWGEGIATTSWQLSDLGVGTPPSKYTKSFGGTSGASAIIAGAALLLQSLYEARNGERLLPNIDDPMKNIRAILSDPATGTPQRLNSPPDPIGVMPNLKKIICKLGFAEKPIA
jgi:serine protease